MKKKHLLIISAALLIISACSLDDLAPLIESQSGDAVATSMAATFEAKDGAIAASAASTFEVNDSIVATTVASTLEASNIISTSIALTLEAIEEIPPPSTNTPLPTMTLPSAASPTISFTPTATVTAVSSSTPLVSVSVGTNCRMGPGKIYDQIGDLRIGESTEVVGKNTAYNYWIIKNPDTNGECWLWGKYATVTGDTSNLQEYAVPPIYPSVTPPTASLTPTATVTAIASSAPIVSVSVGTNCRTGPGKIYDRIGGLRIGEEAEVIGKKTSYNYWIIKNPDANGECWLWGYYATVIGDTSNLQEYAVPPTPTPVPTATKTPTP